MENITWKLLLLSRIILTLIPQTGYIHPDEFFQSIEVFAGNIFNLNVYQPWEFNTTLTERPLRSVTVPCITVGLPLLLLRLISSWTQALFGFPIITPYLLLVLPRLCMAFLSIASDICLYRLCWLYKKNHVKCMITYASSYVMLVHMTRTLSNSVEAVLLAMMLAVVATAMCDMDAKLRRSTKKDCCDMPHCNKVAFLLTVGVFNRPTFVVFAIVPVLTWTLYRINSQNSRWYFLRIWSLVPGVISTSALLVLCDTVYYRPTSTSFGSMQDLLAVPWVITPLNFLLYNTDSTNLEKHGLHPHYVHILVNVPMLFGVLGITALLQYFKLNFTYIRRYVHRWNFSVIDKMIHGSFAVPLLLLSVIPHQEPRFIIALLFPLAFLHGEWLWGRGKVMRAMQMSWILGNCLGGMFFGFLHQGGVISSLIHLQKLQSIGEFKSAQVIFYHTYMPPRSLLLRDAGAQKEDFGIHDMMGGSFDDLDRQIQSLQTYSDIFVIGPTSLRKRLTAVLRPYGGILNTTFPMHISMEDPPPLNLSFFKHLGLDLHTLRIAK